MNKITRCYKELLLAIAFLLVSQGSMSQDCYLQSIDHIGADDYKHELQEEAACKLKDSINIPILEVQNTPVDFKVLSYNLYPVLGAVDEKFGLDKAFEMVENDLVGKTDYLAIVKYISLKEEDEYSLVQEKILKYKVYVDLPDVGGYENLSSLELDALKSHLNSYLVKEQNASNNPVSAEVSTMREMWNYLKKPKNLDGLLSDLQFLKFEVPSEDEFMITRNTDEMEHTIIDAYDNVYNYGGFVLNGETLEESLLTDDPGELATLTSSYYLAGKEVSNTAGEFEEFYDQFSNDPSKVKLFIYFDFETEAINTIAKDGKSDSRNEEQRYGYYKISENLSDTESEKILDNQYESIHEANTKIESNAELLETNANCTPSWKFGRKCLYNHVNNHTSDFGLTGDHLSMQAATIAGFVDGFLGTIQFLVQATTFMRDSLFDVVGESIKFITLRADSKILLAIGGAISSIFENEENDVWEKLKEVGSYVIKMDPVLIGLSGLYSLGKMAIDLIKKEITSKFGGSAYEYIAYQIGVVAFDAVLTGVTGGAYLGAKVIARGSKVASKVGKTLKSSKNSIVSLFNKLSAKMKHSSGGKGKAAYCTIGSGGCFVKDTPVLVSHESNQFSLKNKGKAIAIAAAIPIVAIPIQEVQLLDYVVAHKTVNAGYGLTASVEEDIYLGLTDREPYTSDQQRERDEYEINDRDWNEVIFEEVNGSSTAKLALHNDWIYKNGYQVDAVVNMDLPEQGISGPFKITSIKHIIPQKRPTDEDEGDDYDYRPVTALFTHVSDQVYDISFDSGEELGVTYMHPVYSITTTDWRLAGELEIGEKVLTINGEAIVTKSLKKEGSEVVYNLEVQELHNFLVGESGVVVHNAYKKSFVDEVVKSTKVLNELPDGPLKSALIKLRNMYDSGDPDYAKFMNQFSGGVHLELGENGIKAWKVLKNSDDISVQALKTDKAWLSRASKWMDEGADLEKIGGETVLRKNGVKILEIKNGKILPNKKGHYYQASDGNLIGEPANGYQIVKVGNDIKVKRVPDESSYVNTTYQTKLNEHPNKHTLERHGHDVTDDALIKRANEGIAPDGTTMGGSGPPYPSPEYSSKFGTTEQLKSAFDQTKEGTSLFKNAPTTANGTRKKVILPSNGVTKYGYGVKKNTEDFYDMYRVEAKYELINGKWQLASMHPII